MCSKGNSATTLRPIIAQITQINLNILRAPLQINVIKEVKTYTVQFAFFTALPETPHKSQNADSVELFCRARRSVSL